MENSFLAADAKAENEEEVMYFLIGAIVATVVLVRPPFHHLVHMIPFLGSCSAGSLHPSQEDQPCDPSVPRGRPCRARHAPPRPRPPPHLHRPRCHHRLVDLRLTLDFHCRRSHGGFRHQIHQVHSRPISLVDAMVSPTVVVGDISISFSYHSFPFPSRYHVFGFLWITQFCIACQHLVIAGSVAGWYFSK